MASLSLVHHYSVADLEGLLAYELDILVDQINHILKQQNNQEEGVEFAWLNDTVEPE